MGKDSAALDNPSPRGPRMSDVKLQDLYDSVSAVL